MAKLEIIDFDAALLTDWEYDGIELGVISDADVKASALDYASRGLAYMGVIGDELIGASGIFPMFGGSGFGWAFINRSIENCAKEVVEAMLRLQDEMMDKMKLHRVQSEVAVSDPRATGFARLLGYETEGIMKKFGPNKEDYFLIARVK